MRDDAINSLSRLLGKIRTILEIDTHRSVLLEMISEEEWAYDKKFRYGKPISLGAKQTA
jgi:hypothetical protein